MNRRRRILVAALALLPMVAAAGLWVRSYWRRDLLSWGMDRAESRRISCRIYSSRGRACFVSYSHPAAAAAAPEPLSLQSGDRAATESMSEAVRNQLQQAGILSSGQPTLAYSQHVGSMSTGTHVWTGAVVPWWLLTIIALALPLTLVWGIIRKRAPLLNETPAATA